MDQTKDCANPAPPGRDQGVPGYLRGAEDWGSEYEATWVGTTRWKWGLWFD